MIKLRIQNYIKIEGYFNKADDWITLIELIIKPTGNRAGICFDFYLLGYGFHFAIIKTFETKAIWFDDKPTQIVVDSIENKRKGEV